MEDAMEEMGGEACLFIKSRLLDPNSRWMKKLCEDEEVSSEDQKEGMDVK